MQRVNPFSYGLLFQELAPILSSFQGTESKKGGRRKRDYLRSRITFVFSYIAEHLTRSTLKIDSLRAQFVSFIEEMLRYVSSSPFTVENLQVRENFSILVTGTPSSLPDYNSRGIRCGTGLILLLQPWPVVGCLFKEVPVLCVPTVDV